VEKSTNGKRTFCVAAFGRILARAIFQGVPVQQSDVRFMIVLAVWPRIDVRL